MNRREFLTATGAALITGAIGPQLACSATRRLPNIVFILADDLGYGEVGCYGQKQILTPRMDQLATDGMRFTQCYAGSTVCAPSRTALLTGLHTGHASIRGNNHVTLPASDFTVAALLKQAGYATAVIGKWGMGEPGTSGSAIRQGFDEFYGYANHEHAHNNFPEFLWHNEEKVWLTGNMGGKKKTYSNDLFTRESLDYFRIHKDEPFFLYLNYTIPHANSGGHSIEAPAIEPEYVNKQWPELEKRYASTITRMDRYLGGLRNELAALNLTDDTLIFFAGDNGPHQEGGHNADFFNSHGPLRGIKRDLYEGGIRIPMIATWPRHIEAGKVSDQVWAFWDFLPTVADVIGKPAPANIDGISMLPALLGQPQSIHEYLYWEFHERGFEQAVRLGDWKAVRHGPKQPIELYDLKTDLAEQHDVAAQHADIVARIEDILKTARTDSALYPIHELVPKPSQKT